MCTGLSVAVSIAGMAMSAAGAYSASQARKSQAEYQAAVNRNNAIIAQQNAASVREMGEIAEDEERARTRRILGAAKAVQAAHGFLVDDTEDSSNVLMLADLAEQGELDALRVRHNAALEERRALVQGVNFTAQAGLFSMKAASENPALSGFGTLLGGAGDVAGKVSDAGWFKSSPPAVPLTWASHNAPSGPYGF